MPAAPPAARPRYFYLDFHLDYRCRHAGACCTAGWPIPIERPRAEAVAHAVRSGAVRPVPIDWLGRNGQWPEMAGVLASRADGACAFHVAVAPGEPGCGIHALRPSSCEHFPYVCVIDPRGVHVTLSHYCPTAAARLFGSGAAAIVAGPAVLPGGGRPEGLDATEALPPPARPVLPRRPVTRRQAVGRPSPRLLSWDEVTRWERACVRAVAADRRVPAPPDPRRFDRVRRAVPAPWRWPAVPADLAAAWTELVAPRWHAWAAVIGRYLAARVHASWAMHLGRGPVDVLAGVRHARTVLQVEAARVCADTGQALDRECLTHAIRQADLLLVHYADPWVLAGARDTPARAYNRQPCPPAS